MIRKHRFKCLRYFNPRIREGCDEPTNTDALSLFISIHASARDATAANDIKQLTEEISIHASARDATLGWCLFHHTSSNFNPRIREGCD